ncbi:MAG: glycosyltransferase [Xanthomonadaceae bacterium]|nr:glycosyltransferase [Xanthomonadaceae bacterium]
MIEPQEPHRPSAHPVQHPVQQRKGSGASARKRILIVSSTLHTGGAERIVACLARHLDRERFDVTVCYLKESGVVGEEIERRGTPLVPVPGLVPGAVDRFTWWKLRRLIRAGAFELIHTHDVHGLMDGVACKLLVRGVKHVHTFHWGNYPERETRYRKIERLVWRVPDRLIAVGHRQADAIRQLYSIPPARLKVIWNGVDTLSPQIAPEVLAITSKTSDPVLASISTMIEQKGLHDLLQAAHLLKNDGASFQLLVIGDGHLRPKLEELAKELGIQDRVHFLGWITQASERALPACDIFVQSSLWEAMSVVVLEAMARGKPIVATRVGDNEHMIEDGVSGRLVSKSDPRALADALGELLRDSAQRERLGAAAKARHGALFTTRHMIEAHEALYESLLA